MRKYLIIILILIPSICFGNDAALIMGKAPSAISSICGKAIGDISSFAGAVVSAAASCSASTDYIGHTTIETTNANMVEDRISCRAFQATATSGCTTGNLAAAYMSHHGTGADNAWLALYVDASNDGAGAPVADDTLVANSVTTLSSSTDGENATASVTAGVSVTIGNWYWVCCNTDSTAWSRHYATGAASSSYYSNEAGSYASPPANLTPTSTWTGSTTVQSMYFTIGP